MTWWDLRRGTPPPEEYKIAREQLSAQLTEYKETDR